MAEEWRPHPIQEQVLRRIEYEVLFGGSRGPGKTDTGIVWLTKTIKNPRSRSLVIRKNADDLSDWVDRASRLFRMEQATVAYRPAVITFPSGAIIRTGHLKDDQAYTKYQGHEYQRVLIEELTQIPDENRYLMLLGSCRSTIDIKPQIFCTTNPGGVGHGWVKRRFVDVAPPSTKYIDPNTGLSRIFIPATIDDNPTLKDKDPGYVQYLEGLKEKNLELWKAWRLGDWNTFAGQYFQEFRTDLHVIKPLIPSKSLVKIGGMDWGRVAPFAFLGAAIKVEEHDGVKFNRVIIYQEVYGTDKTPREWGEIIGRHVDLEDYGSIQADNQIFTLGNDSSISIADQFKQQNPLFHKLKAASKDRVGGWENIHNWLSIAPDGLPYLLITENCLNLVRTLPELVHDDIRVEDVDTDSEDHACFCRHTKILTNTGYKALVDVTTIDKVWTPLGWSKVLQLIKQPKKSRLYTFQSMKVTNNHPFLTQAGFRQLKDLTETDKLWNVSISSVSPTGDIQIQQDFPIESILSVVERRIQKVTPNFTLKSGNILKARFPKVFIFIIKILITIETILRILKWSILPTIQRNTYNQLKKLLKNVASWDKIKLGNGIKIIRNFIEISDLSRGKTNKLLLINASNVKNDLQPTFSVQSSVVSTVKCQCLEYDMVYNLETDTGMFTAQGVVVSNSDALRYMLKAIKWIDAKVGSTGNRTNKLKARLPRYQPSINLEKFEKASVKKRDWRSI